MEELFRQHINELVDSAPSKTFLLAVSGGADSSVLAYLFAHCQLNFAIAHCNFHLRGEESNLDMMLTRRMAQDYGVTYFEKEFNTKVEQEKSGDSIEMVARNLRYTWFKEIGIEYDYIVTAHHANDNAETVLLNLSRGTGLKGLTGIPEQNGKILRPLLPFSAQQIRQFAAEKNIAFRNDSSNFSDTFHRNKIRLSVIPKLEEVNPQLIQTFSHNSQILRQQYQFYQHQIEKIKNDLVQIQGEETIIPLDKLSLLDDKILILNEILRNYGFNEDNVKQIIHSEQGPSGKKFLSSTHVLVKDRNNLIINHLISDTHHSIIINSWEELSLYGFQICQCSINQKPIFENNPNIIYVDEKKINFPLILRHWKSGDFFFPFGMKGSKKLSDFFTNQKIDILTKDKIWLLCDGEKIIWVVGFRSDDRFKIDNKTTNYIKIKYNESI
ncbi:MAG: tRNA lysidine(34) synthetase TilS [Bacteroidales bacterium]|nr:tRNA lysidine(34) synthetase TilS [Bacteroidales bacterium]